MHVRCDCVRVCVCGYLESVFGLFCLRVHVREDDDDGDFNDALFFLRKCVCVCVWPYSFILQHLHMFRWL